MNNISSCVLSPIADVEKCVASMSLIILKNHLGVMLDFCHIFQLMPPSPILSKILRDPAEYVHVSTQQMHPSLLLLLLLPQLSHHHHLQKWAKFYSNCYFQHPGPCNYVSCLTFDRKLVLLQ